MNVVPKQANTEEHHTLIKISVFYSQQWRGSLYLKHPLTMNYRTAGLIKAETRNQEGCMGTELMNNYLRDKATTNFEAFVAVTGETHFSPSRAWTV